MRILTRLAIGATFSVLGSHCALAQESIKIGVLTDMASGFSAWSGRGSVIAAEMAAEDFKKTSGNSSQKIEILSADHQNKADTASSIARRWLAENGVNAIVDVPNSAAALAVNFIVRSSNAVFLSSGGGSDALTGKECSPNTVQWTFDLYSLARSTATAAVERGGDSWYFITADYAGGHGLERIATNFVTQSGGKVLGHSLPALNSLDYSPFLLQAQASKAKIVGFGMAGADLMTAIKQAGEFGIAAGGQNLVALAIFINDIHGLGLKAAHGLVFTTAFYWDLDDGKRAFAKRFAERNNGNYPSQVQAGVYAAVLHYLKATVALGSRNGADVVAKMKAMPTDDPLFGNGEIRIDGRHLHDMYVAEVKSPEESKAPWDYLKILKTIPAKEAFRAASAEECSLVK